MEQDNRIKTYSEFWPFYLKEHSLEKTRSWHFIGSSLSVIFMILTIVFMKPVIMLLALLAGYGFAWYSHFYVQKNRPATFKYPFWSLFSDFRMWFLQLTGKLQAELNKFGITE